MGAGDRSGSVGVGVCGKVDLEDIEWALCVQ